MKKLGIVFIFSLASSLSLMAQTGPAGKQPLPDKPSSTAAVSPADLAKAALAAHGGEKLRKMRTLTMKGSVDVSTFGQAFPGAFSTAVSGDKYYFEIVSAVQQLKQVFDGRETYSSIPGFSLPPVTSVGFPILAKVGENGFAIAALPETAKKKRGFRITSPEGFYTDFFVDEKSNQIKGYESAFEVSGRVVTTSVDIDELVQVDGITVPKRYSQRFDLGQITAYASFKTKEILVNSPIEDSAFAIPK